VLSFGFVFLAMVVAMYGIYQWLRASETVWGLPRPVVYFNRASGTFICPNHLAGFLEMVLPLAIALAVTGRMKPLLRIFVSYAAVAIFVGIAATQSRGGWIAAAAGLFALVFLMLRTRRQYWTALLLLVLVTSAGSWLYSKSVEQRVQGTELSGHGREIRLRLWASAWQMWKDNPWWGVGPNHFDDRYRRYREPVDRTQGRPGRAHNDYVNTLADYGVVGLLLALLPVAVALWGLIRAWPHFQRSGGEMREKKSNRSAVVLGASAGLLSLLVHSFMDFNMHIPANAFTAAALLALLTAHIRFSTERYWFTARWPLAAAGSAALAAVLCFMAPLAFIQTRETLLLRQAQRLADGRTEKIELLKRAFALQPTNFQTAYAIAEQLRALAWTGTTGYQDRAREALEWYRRVITLNKWDVASLMGAGMCLDWIDRHDEALPYFQRALELDPNHYRTRAMMGWHEFQVEHYQQAEEWMRKSLAVYWMDNPLAHLYLRLSLTAQQPPGPRPPRP
jgi:O-antigen ligase